MSRREIPRPSFPKRAVITGGMPYGNKQLHFGHIGGVFVPADVFARFMRDRIGAENVIFVSGTDCYGSPIVEYHRQKLASGEFTGTLEEFVKANHAHQKQTLKDYNISLDLFAASAFDRAGEIHAEMGAHFFNTLKANGHLKKLSTKQFYDSKLDCYLNGRQVLGKCPIQHCQSEKGYADECSLGHQYQPQELIEPISALSNEMPELRETYNWYVPMEKLSGSLKEWMADLEERRILRKFATSDIKEFFAEPIVYLHKKHEEVYASIKDSLPAHETVEGKGKSLELTFSSLDDRETACDILSNAQIQFRNGKTLVPFRITGNIKWGAPVPEEDDLTFWVWPESLWAPISFTSAYLESIGKDKDSWTDWWSDPESKVYQFIGEDNVYFYGPAQSAMFFGMQGEETTGLAEKGQLQSTELVVNKHLLFLNSKASSSGDIKPPMAQELREHYNTAQLRAHFIALGLGMKNISFAPKSFNPNANEKDADPVMKEAQLLSNVFNRVARNCFYTIQKSCDGKIPFGEVSADVLENTKRTITLYEMSMASKNLHQSFSHAEKLIRAGNKKWSKESKSLDWDNPGEDLIQPLVDLFHSLRVALILMHPIVPEGTEKVLEYLKLPDSFWRWEHVFEPITFFMEDPQNHSCKELPPRTDFF